LLGSEGVLRFSYALDM